MIFRKTHPLVNIFNNTVVDMPAPCNISAWWNFGSLLGLCLLVQIFSGLFLSFHYCNSLDSAFTSVVHICRDVGYGSLLRSLHANGASFFFICLYLHIGRGIYFGAYRLSVTWTIGVLLLFLSMGIAFLGYVLPWGQMSFWGATVITNLLSTIPYLGESLVQWLWGGFSVGGATLTRFYSLHFILPFILSALVGLHILFLHQTGSSNPLGIKSPEKIPFHPYFVFKDVVGFVLLLCGLVSISLYAPYFLGDAENFNPADSLSTPVHIQPEWYYLFAYAILRAVPNKLGGVLALVASIAVLFILPMMYSKKMQGKVFYPISQSFFWSFVTIVLLLTWIGARPVEDPYIFMGQLLTCLYFSYFFLEKAITWLWDWLL